MSNDFASRVAGEVAFGPGENARKENAESAARLHKRAAEMGNGFMDWSKLGTDLRVSAVEAHLGPDGFGMCDVDAFGVPPVHVAYSFMIESPECFVGSEDWAYDMPSEPPVALVAAYHRITPRHAELWLNAPNRRL